MTLPTREDRQAVEQYLADMGFSGKQIESLVRRYVDREEKLTEDDLKVMFRSNHGAKPKKARTQ
jgi:hypothetical protein